jgi:hypothetical protein
MMFFTGQTHQAVLLSHIQSADSMYYDSLLMVNRREANRQCLVVSLESEAANQPLQFTIYSENGRKVATPDKGEPINRQTFLAAAFFVVEKMLNDRLQMLPMPSGTPIVEEKPLREFYPDSAERLKLHYLFAHRWLPAYVKSEAARFFGYFQRGEQKPTPFIQARWQMMERELKLIPVPTPDTVIIRRVKDLHMSVDSSGACPLAIVQMPTPEFVTHAYFVGIVLLQQLEKFSEIGKAARIFTLEKVEDSSTEGSLCEWVFEESELTHGRYAIRLPATLERFGEVILATVSDPSTRWQLSSSFPLPSSQRTD